MPLNKETKPNQAIEANPARSTRRVSGELGISESYKVPYDHSLIKSICSSQNGNNITKPLENL